MVRWAGHVVHMGMKKGAYHASLDCCKERRHYEDIEIGGKILLKWILEKQNGVVCNEFIWFRTGISGRLL
jgi:hypothetical protein